jgi:hypothetical protein
MSSRALTLHIAWTSRIAGSNGDEAILIPSWFVENDGPRCGASKGTTSDPNSADELKAIPEFVVTSLTGSKAWKSDNLPAKGKTMMPVKAMKAPVRAKRGKAEIQQEFAEIQEQVESAREAADAKADDLADVTRGEDAEEEAVDPVLTGGGGEDRVDEDGHWPGHQQADGGGEADEDEQRTDRRPIRLEIGERA